RAAGPAESGETVIGGRKGTVKGISHRRVWWLIRWVRQKGIRDGQGAAAVAGRRERPRGDPDAGPGRRHSPWRAAQVNRAADPRRLRVDAVEGGAELVAHPQRVPGHDDAARPVTDADGGCYRTGRRVELGDGQIQRVG